MKPSTSSYEKTTWKQDDNDSQHHIGNYTCPSSKNTSPKLTHSIQSLSAQNLEGISLIWYDPSIDKNQDTKSTMNELREINNYVVFHTIEEDCIKYIKSIEDEKIFFVTSGRCAEHILREVHDLRTMDSVFIFCHKLEKYQHLTSSKEFTKIIGIYNKLSSLMDSIKTNIKFAEKQMEVFSFYNQHGEKSTRDLSKESAVFLWFQMFKDMIMRLPRDNNAKQQLIEFCRNYYRGNKKELEFIDEFQRDYTSDKLAIRWYTRETFLYRLVNKAMRTEDIEQLHIFRFFISDLSSNLATEYPKRKDKDNDIVRFYRGLKMEKDEVLLLKQNEGNLISTNGFLSTSRSLEVAQKFASKSTKRTNVFTVLYTIECKTSELGTSVIFADISQFSDFPNEQEVLFDIGTTFKIISVREGDNGWWFVHMEATNEGADIAKEYIKLNREEEEETSVVLIFGKLLQDMGSYDKSLKYFQNLLSNNSQDEDIARIYNLIGTAYYHKKEYDKALENYEHSYDLMMKSLPLRVKDSARPLMNIGLIYHKREEYDRSIELYSKALEILEKYYGKNHLKTTAVLTNIGNSYIDRDEYRTGLKYFENVLEIQKKFLPHDHMETAMTLNNIAVVHQKMNDVDRALEYYEKSLAMKKKLLPPEHKDINTTLMNINTIKDNKSHFEAIPNLGGISSVKSIIPHWTQLDEPVSQMAANKPELHFPVMGMLARECGLLHHGMLAIGLINRDNEREMKQTHGIDFAIFDLDKLS